MAAEAPSIRGTHGPHPEQGRSIRPEQAEYILAHRQFRRQAFEQMSGQDEKGRPRTAQVLRDAVDARLDNPDLAPKGLRESVFSELGGAKQTAQQVLESEGESADTASLAQKLRPAVRAIYINRQDGLKEYDLLSDEQVVEDAKDFSGTVTRELFLRRYLDKVSESNRLANRIDTLAGVGKFDWKINRLGMLHTAFQRQRAVDLAWREARRTGGRLGFTADEQTTLADAMKSEIAPNPDQYPSARLSREELVHQARQHLESQHSKGSGEQGAEGLKGKQNDLISRLAESEADLLMKRSRLADVASRTMRPDDMTLLINEIRTAELEQHALKRAVKATDRAESRRQKLLTVRREGVARLEQKDKTTLEPEIEWKNERGSLLGRLVTETAHAAGGAAQTLGHGLREAAARPYAFIGQGLERIENQTLHRVRAQLDKIASSARSAAENRQFRKGKSVFAVTTEEQADAKAGKHTIIISGPTPEHVKEEIARYVAEKPELARRVEELRITEPIRPEQPVEEAQQEAVAEERQDVSAPQPEQQTEEYRVPPPSQEAVEREERMLEAREEIHRGTPLEPSPEEQIRAEQDQQPEIVIRPPSDERQEVVVGIPEEQREEIESGHPFYEDGAEKGTSAELEAAAAATQWRVDNLRPSDQRQEVTVTETPGEQPEEVAVTQTETQPQEMSVSPAPQPTPTESGPTEERVEAAVSEVGQKLESEVGAETKLEQDKRAYFKYKDALDLGIELMEKQLKESGQDMSRLELIKKVRDQLLTSEQQEALHAFGLFEAIDVYVTDDQGRPQRLTTDTISNLSDLLEKEQQKTNSVMHRSRKEKLQEGAVTLKWASGAMR